MKIKELIVVEGIHDLNKVRAIIDAEILVTHGMGISEQVLEEIKANQDRGVIVLTDPDTPGDKIRQKITAACPWVKHAHLKADDARYKAKVGIEHASSESILSALSNLMTPDPNTSDLTLTTLIELGLSGHPQSSTLRNQVASHYHLSDVNPKKLLARLRALDVQKDDLISLLEKNKD